MSNGAEVVCLDGDFSAEEFSAIAGTLVGVDGDRVCSVVMVVTIHPDGGEHEVRMATTIEDNPRAVAVLLRHAADHAHGGCQSCRDERERRNRHATS